MEFARLRLSLISIPALLLAGAAPSAQTPDGLGDVISVDAGPDRYLVPPAASLTLNASIEGLTPLASSDPSQSYVFVGWSQLSGPPATILGEDTLRPTLVPTRTGVVRLRLKVSTPSSFGSDEVLVYVLGDTQDATITGEARKWHKLALTFQHDAVLSETSAVNPFLDLRLRVLFFHVETGKTLSVPGFFAADGMAATSGATAGDRWRVNFTPDLAGSWYYLVSFRAGSEIALISHPRAGQPASFDGASGPLLVAPADPTAPGFLARGRLDYVQEHHLRFAETGEYYLKAGAGSPENFFGYYEFDGTTDQGGSLNNLNLTGFQDGLHHYAAHLGDYVDLGVPLWNSEGQRIFGAINYLAARGVNSLYALSYNLDGGDGAEVWPWSTPAERLRFDVSKLEQWERVLDHMNRAGIVWHVMTQETENDHALDGGALGTQRKLYYRELVARFGWANGLVWNLGEENTNTPAERMAFADYIREIDPWDHPIALHNRVGDIPETFGTLLGTHLELLSIQGDPTNTPPRARQLVLDSAAAGRPWVVNFDEQTPADTGVLPDSVDFWHDLIRREALWPMLLGQGGGCEWYFGYGQPNDDLDCEDFRSRENLWLITKRALDFVRGHVPFEQMEHADSLALANGASVLAKRGEHYLIYVPFGGSIWFDLEGHAGPFLVSWFDARNGGILQDGSVTQVSGPGYQFLDVPPGPGDWVAFVRRAANFAPEIESVGVEPMVFEAGQDFSLAVHARDPNGPSDALAVTADFIDPHGNPYTSLVLTQRGGSLYSLFLRNAPAVEPGLWQVETRVQDAGGLADTRTLEFEVR